VPRFRGRIREDASSVLSLRGYYIHDPIWLGLWSLLGAAFFACASAISLVLVIDYRIDNAADVLSAFVGFALNLVIFAGMPLFFFFILTRQSGDTSASHRQLVALFTELFEAQAKLHERHGFDAHLDDGSILG
jgi:hypothetical protein